MALRSRTLEAAFHPTNTVLAFPELYSTTLIVGPNAHGKANPTSRGVAEDKTCRSILALLSSDLVNCGIGVCEAVIDVIRVALRIDHLRRRFEHWVGCRDATPNREAKGG